MKNGKAGFLCALQTAAHMNVSLNEFAVVKISNLSFTRKKYILRTPVLICFSECPVILKKLFFQLLLASFSAYEVSMNLINM